MGITSDISADKCGLALVLGGCEVTLLDHVSAMGVFADAGVHHPDTPIMKVTDSNGNVLDEYKDDPGQQVLDPQVAYQVVSVMTDNDARSFVFGPNSPLILPDRVVAAKTGTTQSWRDGWTLGYTPSLVAGVWTGNNDGSLMRAGADGVVVAAPIWHQFMADALKGTPAETFTEPTGIQHVVVDAVSGKLPTEFTTATKEEVFASNALPTQFDDVHVGVKINKLNGKLATDSTPPDLVETKTYTVLHSEMPNNSDWENPVQAWAIANGYTYPPTELDDGSTSPTTPNFNLNFITPANNQTLTLLPGAVEVSVNGTIAKSIDLYMNGVLLENKASTPYLFSIPKTTKNGTQTLVAIAHLLDGSSIQNSITINIQTAQ
jgi:membrane peptidoglycan carboxypeptidase